MNNNYVMMFKLGRVLYCLILGSCLIGKVHGQNSKSPNIIIIVADDLGYNDLSSYGQTYFNTPNTDQLAVEGIRLTRAYSPSAICSPTRYAIITGTDPFRSYHHSHVLFNGEPLVIGKGQPTIASLLKEQGYSTGVIGKWHLGLGDSLPRDINNPGRGPNDIGFDYSFIVPDGHNMYPKYYIENGHPVDEGNIYLSELELLDRVGYKLVRHNAVQKWENLRPDNKIGRKLVTKAKDFIFRNRKNPFFLYLPTCSIHFPLKPDQKFVGKSGIGAHGDFVLEFDWTVGEIMNTIDSLGISQNTILIVTSDNGGYGSVEDSDFKPTYPWKGHKEQIWEGGFRIPFIARWPGRITPGSSSDEPISLVDLFATMADIINVDLPYNGAYDSFTMLPILLDSQAKSSRPFLVTGTRGMKELALRKSEWKLIFKPELNSTELYNLATDPDEQNNIAHLYPDKRTDLKNLIVSYLENGHSRPNCNATGTTIQEIFEKRHNRNIKIVNQINKNKTK